MPDKNSKNCREHWLCAFFISFLSLSLFASRCAAQEPSSNTEVLFSPSVGERFYNIAYEQGNSQGAGPQEIEQAIQLLRAVIAVDEGAKYAVPTVIEFATRYADDDRSQLVITALQNYVDADADLEVAGKGVRYLLDRADSREAREQTLSQIMGYLGVKNKWLDSELSTLLGLLMAEKTDLQSAAYYLMRAYDENKYNRLAFAKLTELMGDRIQPNVYLEHMRLAVDENPLDLEAALNFAGYAHQLQLYETASSAYKYCGDLFHFLYPDRPLPDMIYLPWALSSYNTERDQPRCLQIAASVRDSGVFNIFLEAIAGKAAQKTGDIEQGDSILKAAEATALERVNSAEVKGQVISSRDYGQLAWFYAFGRPEPEKALNFANKAYAVEPNSPDNAALLAYTLAINGQTEWVPNVLQDSNDSQIGQMAAALADAAQDNKDKGATPSPQEKAIAKLKSAIAADPGSLEAEKAKELLAAQGGAYVAPIEPGIILTALKGSFTGPVVPEFAPPQQLTSYRLNLRGSKFTYGGDFGSSLAITNLSSSPMPVTDNSMFTGNIRVDAVISGDLTARIRNLVSLRVRPSKPIAPGQNLVVPLRLCTGELGRILRTHPQAALDIEFTAYLDAVQDAEGKTVNRLAGIEPVRVSVGRSPVELADKFLRNRINSVTSGRQGQKIQVSELFSGLLAEQQAMANREPLYKFLYADWMPAMLKSAIVSNLTDGDWMVKVHTMADIMMLPMDYELTEAVAEGLNDSHWPARLMATYLLAKSQNGEFAKVLDHKAAYDPSQNVRDMAVALGGAKPEAAPEPEATETPPAQPAADSGIIE